VSTHDPYLGEMGEDHPIVWWREFGGIDLAAGMTPGV
jgi:hypothetical protein